MKRPDIPVIYDRDVHILYRPGKCEISCLWYIDIMKATGTVGMHTQDKHWIGAGPASQTLGVH